MSKTTMTARGALTGIELSILLGVVLTWQADREGTGLRPTADIPHPWLYGIAVNGLFVGVFIVPLATTFGRWSGDYWTWRSKQNNDST